MTNDAPMGCLTLESLSDYLHGHGGAETRAQQNAHLATCHTCQANQHWLDEVQALAATDDSFDFPEAALARAVALFQRPQSARPSWRQWLAELVFDSFAQPVLAEVRDGLTIVPTSRQMLFRAESYDIDMRFEPVEPGPNEECAEAMIGQVLCVANAPQGMDWVADVPVQLWQDEIMQAETRTNARGVFKFARIKPGQYALSLAVPQGEIRLAGLETTRRA